ncbi:glycosyltransferase, partial [Campylobacter concisus]|uniref:glycosyltransferase n=1 Tax=Campylobacter concisus TaxID=199 RepID=UPI0011E7F625
YDDCYNREDFKKVLIKEISDNDIILIHWWNHPLLYDVMINIDFPPCRIMIWNHVSSLFPPYSMTEKLVDFTDMLIFTSPVSYECKEIEKLPIKKRKKLDVIWSTVGVESFKEIKKVYHDNFIVGYTGTVDFGKLNPNFIDLCASVRVPNVRFVVCSGDSQQHLKDEAEKKGVSSIFSFEGRVPSVVPYLATFDVFGYPLQPNNFATCEQSIGEAMMAGVVPVVLNNVTEKYIVKHMETGIVAETLDDYHKAIEYLYNNKDELKR